MGRYTVQANATSRASFDGRRGIDCPWDGQLLIGTNYRGVYIALEQWERGQRDSDLPDERFDEDLNDHEVLHFDVDQAQQVRDALNAAIRDAIEAGK